MLESCRRLSAQISSNSGPCVGWEENTHLIWKSVGVSPAGKCPMKRQQKGFSDSSVKTALEGRKIRGQSQSETTSGEQNIQEIEMTVESAGPGSNPGPAVGCETGGPASQNLCFLQMSDT